MDIETDTKKHDSDDSSSVESTDVGRVSQKLLLKFDFIAENVAAIKKNNNLLVANRIFLALWGTSSVFLQAHCDEFLKQGKAILIGYLNFNKSKQKALANFYFLDDCSYIILFNEAIKEYSDCDFPEFLEKTFYFDQKTFEFVLFDNISAKLLKNLQNLENLRFLSTNHHTKESFQLMRKIAFPLEEGNGIEGIGADVLIFCELKGLKANLFLGVNEEYEINISDIKKFEKVKEVYNIFGMGLNEKTACELIKKANKLNYSSVYL